MNRTNVELIQRFLAKAGTSLLTFRYFATRPLTVVENHVCTWVAEQDGQVEGYGHLDRDGDNVWLGIAVTESSRGKGLGRKIMQRLVDSADELGVPSVRLSVDNWNTPAIRLYEAFGFLLAVKNERYSFYEREHGTTRSRSQS